MRFNAESEIKLVRQVLRIRDRPEEIFIAGETTAITCFLNIPRNKVERKPGRFLHPGLAQHDTVSVGVSTEQLGNTHGNQRSHGQ